MVKIRKLFLLVIIGLVLIQAAQAVDVGLVVDFPNGTTTSECVRVADNSNAKAVLEASNLLLQYAYGGSFVYGINWVMSDDVNFLYWSLWQNNATDFALTAVGITDIIMNQEGIVLGFAYGGFDAWTYLPTNKPGYIPYSTVCEKKLQITELKIYVDGDKVSGIDVNGGRIKDVKPESEIKLKIEVSNLYTDDEDIDIDEVVIRGIIEDIDDGDELEEETDDFDIDADDKEDVELIFNVPLKVDEDDYSMTLELEGEDENGWVFEEVINLEVEVDKESHELMILDADLMPVSLECDRTVRLDFRVINTGAKAEEVELLIENSELGISLKESFELDEDPYDEDSIYEKQYVLQIKEGAAMGNYPIKITAEYGNKQESESLTLEVKGCSQAGSNEQTDSVVVMEHKGLPPGYVAPTAEVIVQQDSAPEKKDSKNTVLWIILADIAAVAIGVTIFLVVKR